MLKKRFSNTHIFTLLILFSFLCISSCSSGSGSDMDAELMNDKPRGVDDNLSVQEDSNSGVSNQITVSENDNIGDDGGDGDDYSLLSDATNGSVTEVSDGVFEYIPNADFNGADSFTYIITDKDEDSDFVSIDDTTPDGKVWEKLESMSDEFEEWDADKWFKSSWNYGVPVYMSKSDENSGVADGGLWIRATLNESNPEDRWFQTARIHSKAKISYPMYTEARIKTAHISAYNTYWLNNGNSSNRDEIDIIENNSKPSCNCQPDFPVQMNSQYFHADSDKTPVEIRDEDNFLNTDLSDVNPLKGVKWNEDYHTFGVWWKDSKNIQFYLDGEPAGSVIVGHDRSGESYTDREFTRDLEIIFDLWTNEADWLGGLALKADLADNTINTMRVDWVRTWTLKDE